MFLSRKSCFIMKFTLQNIIIEIIVECLNLVRPNICNGAFFAKIVNSLKPLSIFTKKLHCRCSTNL